MDNQFAYKNFDGLLSFFSDPLVIGVRPSRVLVIFAEFICGPLVSSGDFTRLAVIPTFYLNDDSVFFVHARDTFEAKELSFLFLLLSIVILTSGSGKLSFDQFIFKRK